MTAVDIEDLILAVVTNINLARRKDVQLEAAPDAALFGSGSALDSLGLVALLIDLEEALHDRGYEVALSDARAMSQTRSPFRSVPALVAYIQQLTAA
jgi:acyl carrier protein